MEQSVIDLKKIEAETKEKIKAVNFQKVTITTAIVSQMKVCIQSCSVFLSCFSEFIHC